MSNWVTSIAALGDYRAVIHGDLLVTTSGWLVTRTAILGKCEKMGGRFHFCWELPPHPPSSLHGPQEHGQLCCSWGSFRSSIGFGRWWQQFVVGWLFFAFSFLEAVQSELCWPKGSGLEIKSHLDRGSGCFKRYFFLVCLQIHRSSL